MPEHATVWRVRAQFVDSGGTLREAPTYFRCLDAAREHFGSLKARPGEYRQLHLEELRVVPPVREGLCATLTEEIEDEYVMSVRTLDFRRAPQKPST